MNKEEYSIYKITNKINQKIYIGKTIRTIERRFQEHLNRAFQTYQNKVCRSHLYEAIRKYGKENFEISLVEVVFDIDTLNKREEYWIEKLETRDREKGYNIVKGGDGGATCKGYSWWNDGNREYYYFEDEDIPENLIRGRIFKKIDNSNTIWINNGTIQKHIKIEDLRYYQDWNKGMLPRSEEYIAKQRNKKLSKESILKIKTTWNNKSEEELQAWREKLSKSLIGNIPANKNTIAITNGINNKYIKSEELNQWEELGWWHGFTMRKKLNAKLSE